MMESERIHKGAGFRISDQYPLEFDTRKALYIKAIKEKNQSHEQ
jgi:hypothetical protein